MYIHVYVYMYIYMHICTYMYMCMCMHNFVFIQLFIHAHDIWAAALAVHLFIHHKAVQDKTQLHIFCTSQSKP